MLVVFPWIFFKWKLITMRGIQAEQNLLKGDQLICGREFKTRSVILSEPTYGCWGKDRGTGQSGSVDGHVHTALFKMDNQQ